VDGRIFISGQIGLVPGSLSVPSPQTLATEISLASQHSDRVARALSGHNHNHAASGSGGGRLGRDSDDGGHAQQMILYWVTEERHISYSILAAQRLDVSEFPLEILLTMARCFPYHGLTRKDTNDGFCFPYSEMPRRRSSWL
jgi:hypothetical protein